MCPQVSLQVLLPSELFGALRASDTSPWTRIRSFSCVTPAMAKEMLLASKCFATIMAVIWPIRLNAHMKFNMTIKVLPSTVSLGTSLVRTA